MKIENPLVEILAIKLYEHDCSSGTFPMKDKGYTNWVKLDNSDREIYRQVARGENDL